MLTSDLQGKRVVEMAKSKLRKVGKVRSFVFHPSEKRVVGILVKRPDAAMMFHRKDLFVRLGGFSIDEEENCLVVGEGPDCTDHRAEKALGVELDECVLWWGMPVFCQDGTEVGSVSDVDFDFATGAVRRVLLDEGSSAKGALLGRKDVPASMVLGFRKGIGHALATEDGEWDEEAMTGAIMVSDEVYEVETAGGLAAAAGAKSAVAQQKVRVVVKRAKPKAEAAGAAASEAAEKALFATGRQLGRASGMFSAFKEEYEKARDAED